MAESIFEISAENPFGEGVPNFPLPEVETKEEEQCQRPFQLFRGPHFKALSGTASSDSHTGLGLKAMYADYEADVGFQQASPVHRRLRSEEGSRTHGWSNWNDEDVKTLQKHSNWQVAENSRLRRELEQKDGLLDALSELTSGLREENARLNSDASLQLKELQHLRSKISKTTMERAKSVQERNRIEMKLQHVKRQLGFEAKKHRRFLKGSGSKKEKQQRRFGLEILDRLQGALALEERPTGFADAEICKELHRFRAENADLQVELRQSWRWKKLLEEKMKQLRREKDKLAKDLSKLKTECKKLTKEAKKKKGGGRKRDDKAPGDQTTASLETDLRVANKRIEVLIGVTRELRKKMAEEKARAQLQSNKAMKTNVKE